MRLVPLLALATTLVACGPDPRDPEAERAELRQHGREVYVTYCSLCHGENADGQGVNAEIVRGDPRDFTDPAWRAEATRESVRQAIVEGVPGTSMAAWGLLPERDVEGLVEYLLGVSDGSNVRSGRSPRRPLARGVPGPGARHLADQLRLSLSRGTAPDRSGSPASRDLRELRAR